uniref:Secreted protein n=1 Tax=Brassica oleracea TaxID=3712 RepID=A0A3P6CU91_BRAOL|nr:unnamed protein product [Brassica oleracea]
MHRDRLMNKTQFLHIFLLQLPLPLLLLLNRIRGVMPVEVLVQQPGREHLPINAGRQFGIEEQEAMVHQRTVWEQLIAHWEKEETVRHLLGTPRTGRSDRGGKVSNDGNLVDRLQLIKVAHTNKTIGQIQDPVIKGVVDLVEAEIVSQSQPLSMAGDSEELQPTCLYCK